MGFAAQITSTTTHGGVLQGSGIVTVFIAKLPAAVALDVTSTIHVCSISPPPPHPSSTPVMMGSQTVFIGGKAAARVGDPVGCGATITSGAFDITIGG